MKTYLSLLCTSHAVDAQLDILCVVLFNTAEAHSSTLLDANEPKFMVPERVWCPTVIFLLFVVFSFRFALSRCSASDEWRNVQSFFVFFVCLACARDSYKFRISNAIRFLLECGTTATMAAVANQTKRYIDE